MARGLHIRSAAIGLALVLGGCAPPACSDAAERRLSRDVQVLAVDDDGAVADAARKRLVAAGHDAIVHLEIGLYAQGSDAGARRRIVRTLGELGHPDGLPILDHVAVRDQDPAVREAAVAAAAAIRAR
jgi:hypothetical protein